MRNIYLDVLTPVSTQKNRRVLGRLPGSRRVRFGDEDRGVIYLSAITCNASTMPPRIYTACSSGGGIVKDRDAAIALQGRGFSLLSTNINQSEIDYLRADSPSLWKDVSEGDPVWFMSCHGTVRDDPSLEGSWKRVCVGLPPNTEAIERVEAEPVEGGRLADTDNHVDAILVNQTSGGLERGDFAPALEFLPDEAISGSILVGGDAGIIPAPDVIRKALESCVYFAKLSRSQSNLVRLFNEGGANYSQNRFLQNLISQNAIILGKYAQPTWVVYNSDFMSAPVRRQMDDEAEMGRTQRGRSPLPSLELFGLAGAAPPLPSGGSGRWFRLAKGAKWTSKRFPVTAVFIAGAGAAAVYLMADALTAISDQYFGSIQGEQALYDDVLERYNDPNTPEAERAFYEDLLREWGPPSSPNEGLGSIADLVKYGTIGVAVLAGAWMFGPVIATSVKAAADRRERKSKRQEQAQDRRYQQQRKKQQSQRKQGRITQTQMV